MERAVRTNSVVGWLTMCSSPWKIHEISGSGVAG